MPEFKVNLPKLKEVIDSDNQVLDPFRIKLVEHVREHAGSNYSDYGTETHKPVNVISLFIRIVLDFLGGSDPRMMCSTFTKSYKPYASTLEGWGNRRLVKMKFQNTLQSAILDALFLMGTVKTSITAPNQARFGGYEKKPGEVSMSSVPFEDLIFDTNAKKRSECDYIGHYYDAYYEDVRNSKLFSNKPRLALVPKSQNAFTETGGERISQISAGGSPLHEDYEDKIRLCEVWLRRQNIIVTFDPEDSSDTPLLVQKWIGPACGPYTFLSFAELIGQLLPKAPVMDLIDMDRTLNALWCKTDDQANRSKKITLYKDSTTAKTMEEVKDGAWVQTDNPKDVIEVVLGGPDAPTATWANTTWNMVTEYGGGLKNLGGLASQAKTATQEKLIHESASNLIRSMGSRVLTFTQELMTVMGWFWWMSPREEMTMEYTVPGLPDISAVQRVTPFHRFSIPYDEIDIQMDPYSLVRQTPQMRSEAIDELVKGWLLPAMPMFGQPGVKDVLVAAIKMKGRYMGNPDWEELVDKLEGVGGPPEGNSPVQEPGMPSETTRTYERISKPGMTDEGNAQVLQQMMAGGQPSEGGQGAQGLGQMEQAG